MDFIMLLDLGGFMDEDREERYYAHKYPGVGFRYYMGQMSRETFISHCRYLLNQHLENEQHQHRQGLSELL